MTQRDLEPGIHRDLSDRLTYSGYLGLDAVLSSQRPLSDPPHHDEMMFIILHQTTELWMKLCLHELKAAVVRMQQDDLEPCLKILVRVKHIQRQMFNQWAVLETLTPSEYVQFRDVLGKASGFQSPQFREIEFMLGNKNANYLAVFSNNPAAYELLHERLHNPGVYDEFLRYLQRQDHAVPAESVQRDWSKPYEPNAAVVAVFASIYSNTETYWKEYQMCERLLDLEHYFQLWRFRHMKTVERIIGNKTGTGGSTGVAFLARGLNIRLFPELIDVRTEL